MQLSAYSIALVGLGIQEVPGRFGSQRRALSPQLWRSVAGRALPLRAVPGGEGNWGKPTCGKVFPGHACLRVSLRSIIRLVVLRVLLLVPGMYLLDTLN